MASFDEQIEWWTKQAAHDLEMARSNCENGFHDGCALMCQQSVEKYLKALFMKHKSKTAPKTHQCAKLAESLGALFDIEEAAGVVSCDYMESRYPDMAEGIPYERFEAMDSADRVQAAKKVQSWVCQQMGLLA